MTITWDKMYNFSMGLDYSGGTFNIGSTTPIGIRGQNINVFGLNATITDAGKRYNNSMKGPSISGIFGAPLLNKQFRFLTGSSALLNSLNNINPKTGIGVKSIAAMIARQCGINLTWVGQDWFLTNFSLQPTMNGISALNSLAQQVNCNLRWFGNNNYYIAPPSFTLGSFVVPSPYLLGPNGIEAFSHYDLETGVGGAVNLNSFGTPVQTLTTFTNQPLNSNGANGTYTLPNNALTTGLQTPLIPVGGTTKKLTINDPPQVWSLPPNYQDVMVQIVIPGSFSANGRYLTIDPSIWDVFVPPVGSASFGGKGFATSDYIFKVYEGGAYVNKVKIDYKIFPDHPAVNAGNFNFNMACTTNNPAAVNGNTIPNQPLPPQYVQTYKGTINCLFYGILPLPGMFASATLDDLTVSGVIESVSLSPPGFLQLNVAQYTIIKWMTPYLDYNLGTA